MNKLLKLILIFSFLLACKNNNQSAREPIQHQRQSVDMFSVKKNKELNKREETYIRKIISQDTLHNYIDSGHGFWYYMLKTVDDKTKIAEPGDKVLLTYQINDLSDNIIYAFAEIGEKWYWVDHENYFRGFREAVKLLREGEEALFIFPSNAAYGVHGDEKKIGNNIPLKMHIKILKINKQKTE